MVYLSQVLEMLADRSFISQMLKEETCDNFKSRPARGEHTPKPSNWLALLRQGSLELDYPHSSHSSPLSQKFYPPILYLPTFYICAERFFRI